MQNRQWGESLATIKDIATRAGVTATTVSRVINNRGYISKETREKVHRAMAEMHYRPNELARALSKRRANTIVAIVPHISHPFFAFLISCLEEAAAERGYKLLLCNSRQQPEKESEFLAMSVSNNASGIVLCSKNVCAQRLRQLEIPIINLERDEEGGETIAVHCDNYQGGRLAALHLIERGCSHLLHFGGITGKRMPADLRSKGFSDVCEKHGVPCTVLTADPETYASLRYCPLIEEALRSHPETDGIFASSDLIAAQVLQVCARMGISVPGSMKVVGFDGSLVASLTSPTITTIRQPVPEMARLCVEHIDKLLRGELVPNDMTMPVELVQGESS